jgi:hypothetical protein
VQGVPDVYAPAIHKALSHCSVKGDSNSNSSDDDDDNTVTISDATEFYLGSDPLDQSNLPTFRRNMIYIREIRYMIAIFLEHHEFEDTQFFDTTLSNQDYLMGNLTVNTSSEGIPPFGLAEVLVIYFEGLEEFFEKELARVVSHLIFSLQISVISPQLYSLILWRLHWIKGPVRIPSASSITPQPPDRFQVQNMFLDHREENTLMKIVKRKNGRLKMPWIKTGKLTISRVEVMKRMTSKNPLVKKTMIFQSPLVTPKVVVHLLLTLRVPTMDPQAVHWPPVAVIELLKG